MEASYIDGLPAWKARPQDSDICILSKAEMDAKSPEEIQKILRHKHIYVEKDLNFKPKYGFDEEGLATLTQLDRPVIIHGESATFILV